MGVCWSGRRRKRKEHLSISEAPLHVCCDKIGAQGAEPRPDMANTISNLKMTNPIKNIVSKRRKRYTKDGFNLDLTYITERLIAMGFPAEKVEGLYRNHIDDVYMFLEQKHKDHYKIYNLCSERSYDHEKFHKRVSTYAFPDHNPPNIELIFDFCRDVHKWLSDDPKNVAAVHCKAGKGRTGTMVCCYLLHSGEFNTAAEALNFYGHKRTTDKKGVTIPSQRRYVEYFEAAIRRQLEYRACAMHIRAITMQPPPTINGGQGMLELTVSLADPIRKVSSTCHEVRKGDARMTIAFDKCTPLSGDVKVEVFSKPKMMIRKEKLLHFWFNTFFVTQQVDAEQTQPLDDSSNLQTFKLSLDKSQLDDAHKDKQNKLCSSDFRVELIVQKIPESSGWSGRGPRANTAVVSPPSSSSASPSPASSSDEEPDEHWDSGESTYL